MKLFILISIGLFLCFNITGCRKGKSIKEEKDPYGAFIQRVLPQHATHFKIDSLSGAGDKTFEIESKDDKIVLRGNNGVAIASALYYYLKEYAHCQITWNGTNLNLPDNLPKVPKIVKKNNPV